MVGAPRGSHLEVDRRIRHVHSCKCFVVVSSDRSRQVVIFGAAGFEGFGQPRPGYFAQQRIAAHVGFDGGVGVGDYSDGAVPRGLAFGVVEKHETCVSAVGIGIERGRIVDFGLKRHRPRRDFRRGRYLTHVEFAAERVPLEGLEGREELGGRFDFWHVATLLGRRARAEAGAPNAGRLTP